MKKHTAATKRAGKRISIVFTPPLGAYPGVYRVVRRADERTFYVGEGGDLSQRLKVLFRCRPSSNPHPCQSAFERAYGKFPTPEQFCEIFEVYVQDTGRMRGRLEIEEELHEEHGSNNADFYNEWNGQSALPRKTGRVRKETSESCVVPITRDMRKTGTWFFCKALSDQLPEKGQPIRIIFPKGECVQGRIGFSKAKFLNKARSALKEFVAKRPKAKSFNVELGFEGENQTLRITI